jgi:flagellar hook-associated protein 2
MSTNRLTGLISGLDTESLVQQLVSAYSVKKDSVVKKKTLLEWKQEKWKELNTKIYSLYSKTVSNMQYSSAYTSKKTTVSDETKASVVASDGAVNGTQTLSISKLAASDYLTGAKLTGSNGTLTGSSTLKELGITSETSFVVKATANGAEKTITVNGDTTLKSLATQLKNTGLNANFDETQQRLYISAKNSGTSNAFSITASDADGVGALMKLGLYTKDQASAAITSEVQADWDKWSAYEGVTFSFNDDGTVDLDSITGATDDQKLEIKSYLEAAYQEKLAAFEATQNTTMETMAKKFEGTDLNIDAAAANWKDYQEKTTIVSDLQDAYDAAAKKVEDGDEDAVSDLELESMKAELEEAKKAAEDAADIYKTSVTAGDSTVITNSEIQQYITAKANLNEDYEQNKADLAVKNSDEFFGKVSNAISSKESYASLGNSSYGSRIAAADCVINLNGVEYTSDTNSVTVNGLTISCKATTTSDLSIVTDNDYQKVYDNIKNFFKEYNTLINEMDSLYNADSASDYEPLTDDEKDAMSDSDIEKWETKIKDALLRRDTELDTISETMKNAMSKVYEVNGKKYSLASFGISTLGYFNAATNEKNAYHIDGDADDSNTSGNTDKLMSMIASDPDTVTGFFTQLT